MECGIAHAFHAFRANIYTYIYKTICVSETYSDNYGHLGQISFTFSFNQVS